MHTSNPRDSIVDERLPDFVDLVIWGHEHESQTVLRAVDGGGFQILQPGSTVPTSLIDAESKTKHSFLLCIDVDKMIFEPIPLLKQRPVIYRQLELSKVRGLPPGKPHLLEQYIKKEV